MGAIRYKAGVQFARIDADGFRLLGSLERVVRAMPFDVTLTCGTEGHPATDPHSLGRAYDVRSHGLTEAQKDVLVRAVLIDLEDGPGDAPLEVSGGWATRRYFGWLEHPGEPNEHVHLQLRKGASPL